MLGRPFGSCCRTSGIGLASVTIAARLESKVEIANWNTEQTYLGESADTRPILLSVLTSGKMGSLQGLSQPIFDFDVTTLGEMVTCLKPTVKFGIVFYRIWKVEDVKVVVVTDGWA